MDETEVLEELEGLAERLDMQILFGDFRGHVVDIESGSCLLKGKKYIIVDRALPCSEKARIIAGEMADKTLEGFYMSPYVRALLEGVRAEKKPARPEGSPWMSEAELEKGGDPSG